eukprot:4920859-Prymnesium_polylepis.1
MHAPETSELHTPHDRSCRSVYVLPQPFVVMLPNVAGEARALWSQPASAVNEISRNTICADPSWLKIEPSHECCRKSVKVAIISTWAPSRGTTLKMTPTAVDAVLRSIVLLTKWISPPSRRRQPASDPADLTM